MLNLNELNADGAPPSEMAQKSCSLDRPPVTAQQMVLIPIMLPNSYRFSYNSLHVIKRAYRIDYRRIIQVHDHNAPAVPRRPHTRDITHNHKG